ncbi:MAG: LysM peptidoglycan-binding domain-containing protein [Anaerolineae bacterium]
MDDPKYEQDYDYEDYEDFRRRGVTGVGLPPGQLALIIGVNAVISLIISVGVVLLVGRAGATGDVTTGQVPPSQTTPVSSGAVITATVAATSGGATQTVSEGVPARPASYVIQPGDTLSAIAERFAVPMAD